MARTLDQGLAWTPRSIRRNRMTNVFEPIQPYLLLEFSARFKCTEFLDIGANIGFYSVVIGTSKQSLSIHAYEPMPEAFTELSANIAANGLAERTTLRQIALSASEGEAEMTVVSPLSGANAISATAYLENEAALRSEKISMATLDADVAFSGKTVAVKIDVEGHEAELLRGGQRFLSDNQCVIQYENVAKDARSAACEEILTALGYKEMTRIGPDRYVTNMAFSPEDVLSQVSRATSRFVEASKEPALHPDRLTTLKGFLLTAKDDFLSDTAKWWQRRGR